MASPRNRRGVSLLEGSPRQPVALGIAASSFLCIDKHVDARHVQDYMRRKATALHQPAKKPQT
jgi:hypothetical protein